MSQAKNLILATIQSQFFPQYLSRILEGEGPPDGRGIKKVKSKQKKVVKCTKHLSNYFLFS